MNHAILKETRGSPHARDPACPLCGGHKVIEFRREGALAIVRCYACGLMFTEPQPTQEELVALYGESYFHSDDARSMAYDDYIADGDNIVRSSRRRVERIERILGRRGNQLLDVGCATGFFLKAAVERGYDAHGVEISRYCVNHLVEPKANVVCGTLEDARYPDAKFDLITMWDVVEHLKNPRAVLTECARIARPNAGLVLMTPNIDGLMARLMRSRWVCWQDPHIHLFYYGPAQIKRELERTGWRVKQVRTFWHGGKHVPMKLVFERLGSYLRPIRPMFNLLERSKLSDLVMYLDAGDNMVVYAERS
jgi:2-polyprenyl-3-methyl-5-hydroxy-6-metoxy-1,4-benzoquinol methylase